jgi:hypothetical protein
LNYTGGDVNEQKGEWPPHRGVSLECTGNANERGLAGLEHDVAGPVFHLSFSTAGPPATCRGSSLFLLGLTADNQEKHSGFVMQIGSRHCFSCFSLGALSADEKTA